MKHIIHSGLLLACSLFSTVHAQTIEFGKIGDERAFKQHWKLDDDEMKRYKQYMDVAGRFRHQNVDPLTVLSMIAQDPEDKAYYAKMAAEYEHKAVKAEIETAYLISEAMSIKQLEDDMQKFTDTLTGIVTTDYVPYKERSHWQVGDDWIVLVDQRCANLECLKAFVNQAQALPSGINKTLVVRDDWPLADDEMQLIHSVPGLEARSFDPIEHAYLENTLNQALHVRDRKVLGKASQAISNPTMQSEAVKEKEGNSHEE